MRGAPSTGDEALLRRYRSGDRAAMEVLIDRHAKGAVRFAAQLLGDSHEAEDVAQECFLKLVVVARNGAYDPRRGRFAPFFFRLVRNLAIDRLREKRPGSPIDPGIPAPSSADAALRAERGEGEGRLLAIVRNLPDSERAAIVLREFEDLSYRDIAEILGASLEQVKIWIFRARRRIERVWTAAVPENGASEP